MFSENQVFEISKIEFKPYRKSEIRERMDQLAIGEGFFIRPQPEKLSEIRKKAKEAASKQYKYGRKMSVTFAENKTALRVIRTA